MRSMRRSPPIYRCDGIRPPPSLHHRTYESEDLTLDDDEVI
jgi:hypothetical protein